MNLKILKKKVPEILQHKTKNETDACLMLDRYQKFLLKIATHFSLLFRKCPYF